MKKTFFARCFLIGSLLISFAVLQGCGSKSTSGVTPKPAKVDAIIAKQLLTEGNARFVSGKILKKNYTKARQAIAQKGQTPFAVVLSCSESDVPPEVLFDQNLGDLLVVRTVGNVIDPLLTGSIEYGVEHYKAPLVVVLGHTNCGIVKEAVENKEECPGNIPDIQEKMKSTIERAKETKLTGAQLLRRAEVNNVWDVKSQTEESHIVQQFKNMGLEVLGAMYDSATGKVQWFEDSGCDLGAFDYSTPKGSINENNKENTGKHPEKQWVKPTDKIQ